MSDFDGPVVPLWTLSTTEGAIGSAFPDEGALDPPSACRSCGRPRRIRVGAAGHAGSSSARGRRDRAGGLPLDAMSPLAQESHGSSPTRRRCPPSPRSPSPAKSSTGCTCPQGGLAIREGLVKPMASKAVNGGVYGDLVASTGKNVVAAKATFVPVEAAAAGATGTAVGTAAGTAAAGTAMTVAAPLVLMAVAVGASAYADHERQKAIENITELLEKLHDDKLESERSELDGCRDAIDKATALLLDRGKVGASLGLDSAVHAISVATQKAARPREEVGGRSRRRPRGRPR